MLLFLCKWYLFWNTAYLSLKRSAWWTSPEQQNPLQSSRWHTLLGKTISKLKEKSTWTYNIPDDNKLWISIEHFSQTEIVIYKSIDNIWGDAGTTGKKGITVFLFLCTSRCLFSLWIPSGLAAGFQTLWICYKEFKI